MAIITDISNNQRWIARKGNDNNFTISFVDSSSVAYDISSTVFTLKITDKIDKDSPIITLTEASGLTNNGATGVLDIALTEAQISNFNTKEDYFWELEAVASSLTKTWFQGIFDPKEFEYTGSTASTLSVTISSSSTTLTATIFPITTSIPFELVQDTTPQLGGNLDVNGYQITTASGLIEIIGESNQIYISSNYSGYPENYLSFTLSDRLFLESVNLDGSYAGFSTNGDNNVQIYHFTSGGVESSLKLTSTAHTFTLNDNTIGLLNENTATFVNYSFDIDQTVGAGQDNYVLTYDNITGLISLEETQNSSAFTAAADTTISPTSAITLSQATGNEAALTLNYTVNKATSGNDTGLLINKTDTASPGTSYLIDSQTGGVSKFSVDDAGNLITGTSITGATSLTIKPTSGAFTLDTSAAADSIVFNINGSNRLNIDNTRFQMLKPLYIDEGVSGSPQIRFSQNDGLKTQLMYLDSGDIFRIFCGASALEISNATQDVSITGGVLYLNSYTVAGVPSASTGGGIIYISDESGGAQPAYSDGTNWRRFSDGATIS